ncbi:hypothetical protein D3C80_1826940 [compost metagenome]
MLVRVDLTVNGVARTAGSCSVRAAALCYEARDNAVEYKTVVETVVSQLLKVGYSVRSIVLKQVDQHYAAVLKCYFRLLCHM